MAIENSKTMDQSSFPIIGIGASAGGISPIKELVEALPLDLGAAVVVIVHLDPKERSHVREIIAQVAGRPVCDADDGMQVQPNCIYVIPPNRDLTIANGFLQVTPCNEGRRLHAAIDGFFISLAQDCGDQAYGVVLSGTGTDGTVGLREIKANGGITFAQDEASAKQPGMPRSAARAGCVDFVLNPRDIARDIASLIRGGDGHRERIPKDDLGARETLLGILREQTDVDFSSYKQTTIWRRVYRRMALKRIASLGDYVAVARADAGEIETLYKDILISVTSFFRDTEVFDALKRFVFPKVVAESAADGAARIWVPGCSTGEEAYSIAMAFRDYLEEAGQNLTIQIFGTDVNESVIEKARAGLYAPKIAESVSQQRLDAYFVKTKHGYQVSKTLRDLCIFARQNVAADPPLSKMDFISCRNMLIYLGPVLQRKVIPRLHYALKPGGSLLLGKSEVVDIFSDLFTPIDKHSKVYAKKSVTQPLRLDFGGSSGASRGPAVRAEAPPPGVFAEIETHREVDRLIAARYSPPAVVINERLDILQFRGDVKPLLDLGSGLATLNITKVMSREFSSKVRELIEQSKSGLPPLAIEGLQLRHDGSFKKFNVRLTTLRTTGERDGRFLLVFESSSRDHHRQAVAPMLPPSTDLAEHLARLEEEVRATREHLQSTVDESEIRHEELQAANEEILSNNEELQTMNQELETSKEELESANEELVTLNEELQNHLEKLRESEERFRILVSGVKEYAIFRLSRDGHVLSWNEGAERIKGYRSDQVLGRHFSVFYRPEDTRSGKPQRELEIASEKGSYSEEGIRVRSDGSLFWAHVVITALHDESGAVVGFAKVTRDITERRAAEDALRRSEQKFRLLVSAVQDYAIVMLSVDGKIQSWNEGAERITGYNAAEVAGQHISMFYRAEDRQSDKARLELEAALRDGKYEEQGERRRKDGSYYVADIVITPLYAEDGQLEGFAKVTRDITERRRAEIALQKAHDNLEIRVREATRDLEQSNADLRASNAELSQFAYVASHDLKEPLRMVKAYTQLLLGRYQSRLDAEAQQFVGFVVEGASRMEALINDLLAYAAVGKADVALQEADLNTVVATASSNLRDQIAQCGAEIIVDNLPRIQVIESQLVQVFQNLIGNAIKFRGADRPVVRITSERKAGSWLIAVRDNGIGIEQEYLERIFLIFQRLHGRGEYPGTGVGLSICKKIIERHGGRTWVESVPGEGSTFFFTLPGTVEGGG